MLIGIDASRCARARRTGTENYCRQIIRALLDLDPVNRYRLYYNRPAAAGPSALAPRAETRVLPSPYLWTHARLGWEVLRRPPDVLFVPAHVVPLYCRPPAVVTIHDLGYLRFPEAHRPAARLYLRLSTAHSARAARRVIAVSAATKADLVTTLGIPAEKVAVVPEACPPGFAPLSDREAGRAVARRYGLDGPYLISLGTLHPRKNLVRLLEAFALARREARLPHRLALVGQVGFRGEEVVAAIGRLGLGDAVALTGYVPAAELPLLLGAADALAFPSLHEGFGLPVLEAMACDVPVLAANTSSLPEVVGNAGLLVDPLDVPGMALALGRLLTDAALRADLVARGRQRVGAYTWERAARETLAVLASACQS